MTRVRNFISDLAKAGNGMKAIQNQVEAAYGPKAISRSQIYKIMSTVKAGKSTEDQRHLNPKKTARTPD